MPTFLCQTCTNNEKIVEFATLKELDAHAKGGHLSGQDSSPGTAPWAADIALMKKDPTKFSNPPVNEEAVTSPRIAKEIELLYKYEGECPDCFTPVQTIMVPVGDFDYAVAYCSACKRQFNKQAVIPISQQEVPDE